MKNIKHDDYQMIDFFYQIFNPIHSDLEQCYQSLTDSLLKLQGSNCKYVSLWSCSQGENRSQISLLMHSSHWKSEDIVEDKVIDKSKIFFRSNIDTLTTQVYAYHENKPEFAWSNTYDYLDVNNILVFPVLNRYDSSILRFMVECGFSNVLSENILTDTNLEVLAGNLSRVCDNVLDGISSHILGEINSIIDSSMDLDLFIMKLRILIIKYLKCEGCSIFLHDIITNNLVYHGDLSLIRWRNDIPVQAQYYSAVEKNYMSEVLTRKLPIFIWNDINESNGKIVSQEFGGISRFRNNILCCSISNIGVVRCRNKTDNEKLNIIEDIRKYKIFTDDDAAILDNICQLAAPYIKMMIANRERNRTLAFMVHELSMPLNTLRAVVSLLQDDLSQLDSNIYRRISNYSNDIMSYTTLMSHAIANLGIYGLKDKEMRLDIRKPIFIIDDVLRPIVRHLWYLLENKNFDINNIYLPQYGKHYLHSVSLYVDQIMMQQLFFNLLSNAIKYSFNNPNAFKIEISIEFTVINDIKYYQIKCKDYGPGIQEEISKYIFNMEVRGISSMNDYIPGKGIGLWVVRRIIEAHGGFVKVTNHFQPTEISVFLPESLRSAAPPQR